MEDDNNISYFSDKQRIIKRIIKDSKSKYKKRHMKKVNKRAYNTRKFIFIILSIIIIFFLIFFLIFRYRINTVHKFDFKNIHNVFNYSMRYDEYNENINKNYKYLQNYFCENPKQNINQDFENKIRIAQINSNEKKI